jgi:heme-degrading monooxygenase HmoA
MIAKTPKTPYYAVIFTTIRTEINDGYEQMAIEMEELAKLQPGYLGIESARSELGITVSYWESLEAIKAWKYQVDHKQARHLGREKWYTQYHLRICKVEHDYGFEK